MEGDAVICLRLGFISFPSNVVAPKLGKWMWLLPGKAQRPGPQETAGLENIFLI